MMCTAAEVDSGRWLRRTWPWGVMVSFQFDPSTWLLHSHVGVYDDMHRSEEDAGREL